ncbi:MAG: hypothetical protein Kow0081_0660 [Candidatus Dojkabacteria bacterium]
MDLLLLRPLIWGLIEYILAFLVYRNGRFERKSIALFLFFLGSYQIGEAVLQLTDLDMFGLKFAYFSTTFLPPFGFYFLNRITGKNINYSIPFVFATILAVLFVVIPEPVKFIENVNCIAKVTMADDQTTFGWAWAIYYFTFLVSAIILGFYYLFKIKNRSIRSGLIQLILAYIVFYPSAAIVILLSSKFDLTNAASLMCAFAIFTAVIISRFSFTFKKDE